LPIYLYLYVFIRNCLSGQIYILPHPFYHELPHPYSKQPLNIYSRLPHPNISKRLRTYLGQPHIHMPHCHQGICYFPFRGRFHSHDSWPRMLSYIMEYHLLCSQDLFASYLYISTTTSITYPKHVFDVVHVVIVVHGELSRKNVPTMSISSSILQYSTCIYFIGTDGKFCKKSTLARLEQSHAYTSY
jgi:hypothetical protein